MKVRMAGHIAAVGQTHNEYKYSYSEEAIPFGAGVMRGTNKESQCKLMTTGGDFLGIALFTQKNSYDPQEYGDKSTVEILTRGQVYVQVEGNVTAGDKAGCGNSGKFNKSGVAGYDDINAVYETTAVAGDYAILKLK